VIVRDPVEIAIDMVREEKMEGSKTGRLAAEDRLIDLLNRQHDRCARGHSRGPKQRLQLPAATPEDSDDKPGDREQRTREKLRQQFREGKLDERTVELDVRDRNQPSFEVISNQGSEEMDINLKDMLPGLFGQRTKKRKMKVAEAFDYLVQEEENRLIDMDQVTRPAVERVEDSGSYSQDR
jgi:ATP-dependent HslUV protease ATP-binding subunit HslU